MTQNVSDPLCIQRASPGDQVEAITLLFSHLSAAECDRQVAKILAESAGSPPAGLWVAYRKTRLVAAGLAKVQPGRTAFVSVPRLTADETAETARELLASLVADLPRQGVQLAQTLLETDHGPQADLLIACGFRHVSNLLYLVGVQGSFPTSRPNDGLEFTGYKADEQQRMARLVERTYGGSLDCPAMDGVRRIEDVLEGYRATGLFDPARWIIVRHQGSDIGCLLLTDHPQSDQWELVYMGVVPEARGHGWGVAIARHAQWLTRQAERKRLVLAVDAANAPALAAYATAGFVAWDHRSVYLRMF
ncbi:MAG: GNAT family N-acetyltransferase [Planctomycetia bacterium]|nr:GNAT family N-acetyltransferase [Planctomycetia bacterium]